MRSARVGGAWRVSATSRTGADTGRAGAAAPMSLLPFLDIIFGTIGIFVVTFALQNLVEVKDGIPLGVDSIVTCIGGDELKAHWPDGTPGPVAVPERSLELLQALASAGRPFRSLLVAVGGKCIKARRAFLDGLEQFLDAAAGSVAADGSAPTGLMLELFPIGDATDEAALLEEWRGGDTR